MSIKRIQIYIFCVCVFFFLFGCRSSKFEQHTMMQINHEKQLVIFTSHKPEVYIPIVNEFEHRTGIHVEVYAGGTTEMLEKIKNSERADVMFGGDVQNFLRYEDAIEPYCASGLEYLDQNVQPNACKYTIFSELPLVFIYNNKLVNVQRAPHNWNDFFDESWKAKISFADPNHSGTSISILSALVLMCEQDMNEVSHFYQQLDGNVAIGSGDVIEEVNTGTRLIGITLEETAKKGIDTGMNISMSYPQDKTVIITDGTFLLKGARNEENAKKFIDFTISEDVQKYLEDYMFRRSVRVDQASHKELKKMIQRTDLLHWKNLPQEEIFTLWNEAINGNN